MKSNLPTRQQNHFPKSQSSNNQRRTSKIRPKSSTRNLKKSKKIPKNKLFVIDSEDLSKASSPNLFRITEISDDNSVMMSTISDNFRERMNIEIQKRRAKTPKPIPQSSFERFMSTVKSSFSRIPRILANLVKPADQDTKQDTQRAQSVPEHTYQGVDLMEEIGRLTSELQNDMAQMTRQKKAQSSLFKPVQNPVDVEDPPRPKIMKPVKQPLGHTANARRRLRRLWKRLFERIKHRKYSLDSGLDLAPESVIGPEKAPRKPRDVDAHFSEFLEFKVGKTRSHARECSSKRKSDQRKKKVISLKQNILASKKLKQGKRAMGSVGAKTKVIKDKLDRLGERKTKRRTEKRVDNEDFRAIFMEINSFDLGRLTKRFVECKERLGEKLARTSDLVVQNRQLTRQVEKLRFRNRQLQRTSASQNKETQTGVSGIQ